MHDFGKWIAQVEAELGLDAPVDEVELLDVTRVVAHGVSRPAAPVTTYLMGLAVGAGADPAEVSAKVRKLAADWEEPTYNEA